MDVVLTSPENLGGIYRDNRRWAQQFVDHDPANRNLIEVSTAEEAVTATERAAVMAGSTGRVIYAVGHGAGADGDDAAADVAGSADFAPRLRLRVTQFVVFFEANTVWPGNPISEIESDLFAAQALRGKRRDRAIAAWFSEHFDDQAPASELRALRRIAVRSVSDRSRSQPFYDRIAAAYRANPVSRVVLLTCNVANAEGFVDEIATDFGVRVLAYRRKVMSTTRRPVRMFLEGDNDGDGSNTARATHEIPPTTDADDYYVARPQTAPALPERRPTTPPVEDE
ncbi:MAG: hypothetical protein R2729_08335 [Bryobacteraceae bacterium]